jgi:hypothetical protein
MGFSNLFIKECIFSASWRLQFIAMVQVVVAIMLQKSPKILLLVIIKGHGQHRKPPAQENNAPR